MKVLLIKSPFDLAREGLGLKKSISSGYLPALGLAYLSAVLKRAGHEVITIDSPASGLGPAEIRDCIATASPDWIGFSLQIADAETGLDLINSLTLGISQSLVLGGPFITHSFREAARVLRHPAYLVLGEGERPILNLVDYLLTTQQPACAEASAGKSNHPSFPSLPGVLYRDHDGTIHGSPGTDPVPDLDSLPFPDWDIFFSPVTDHRSLKIIKLPNHPAARSPSYSPFPSYFRNGPAFPMITSRGCPYGKCLFCFQGGEFAPPYRRHSPERVIAEMEELSRKYGIREIVFVDDIFTVNPSWMEKFCSLIIESNLTLSWVCYGKADLVNPEMLRRMKNAGCYQIKFGVESGNPEILTEIRKGFSLSQVREAVRLCRETGLEANASFILGLPGETPEKGENTVRFALELNPDFAEFFACQPLPGTLLHARAQREGRLLSDRLAGGSHEPNYLPEGYPDPEAIRRLVKSAYRRFYLRPSYFAKSLRKIRSVSDIKRYAGGLQLLTGIIT
ncbi:MAG: radical SAM protein [bacterium]|nr:radical SAM protein [bacterium]